MDALKNLGIDPFGLLVYLVNFGLIMIVLTKYLYKPMMTFLDERRETVRRSIEEAEELKSAFQVQMAAKEQEQDRAVRALRAELAQAKAYADEKAKAALAEVEAERVRMMEKTRGQMEEMKKDLVRKAEGAIIAKMKEVVSHVVRADVPQDSVGRSVERAWDRVRGDGGV